MSTSISLSISNAPQHTITFDDGYSILVDNELPHETVAAICSRISDRMITVIDVALFVSKYNQYEKMEMMSDASWSYYTKNIRDTYLWVIDHIWKPSMSSISFDNCKIIRPMLHQMGYVDKQNPIYFQEYGSTSNAGEIEDVLQVVLNRHFGWEFKRSHEFVQFLFLLGFDTLSWG